MSIVEDTSTKSTGKQGESAHLPEPWVAQRYDDRENWQINQAKADGTIADVYEQGSPGVSEANARRIAACVNACEGVPADVLQAISFKNLVATLKAVRCPRCSGRGTVYRDCTLCGDSTFDHECNDGERECAECNGSGRPAFILDAINKAEGRAS